MSTLLAIEAIHTLAAKSCIFAVDAVMAANSIVATINKFCLSAVADQVIQVNRTRSSAKVGTIVYLRTCKVTKQAHKSYFLRVLADNFLRFNGPSLIPRSFHCPGKAWE